MCLQSESESNVELHESQFLYKEPQEVLHSEHANRSHCIMADH